MALTGASAAAALTAARMAVAKEDSQGVVTPEMFGARRDDPEFDNAEAIEQAFATGRQVWFGSGEYHVARSVGPGRQNARAHFDNTTIRISEGARFEDFTECLGWDGKTLQGRESQGNLPGIDGRVRVLFDLTDSRFSIYTGRLQIRGDPDFQGLAAIASSNHRRISGGQAGGAGSVWDCNLVISFAAYGLFGTPRFDAPSNEFYPDPFAGSVFGRVWIHSCPFPLFAGANTLDDSFMGVLHLALRDGDRGYLLGTALNAGSIFMRCNGKEASAVALDVREGTLSANTFYAENSFYAPIVLQHGAWINGTLRHGAGSRSKFAKRAMVYCAAPEAGGFVTAHERCRDSRHMEALIRLRARDAQDARAFVVHQPYPESEKAAFAYEDGEDAPPSTQDSLLCHAPGGWTCFNYQNGRLLRYRRSAVGGPFMPIKTEDADEERVTFDAFYGQAVIRTGGGGTRTLFVRYAAFENAGSPVVCTDFRIDARHPISIGLSPVESSDLGRQIVISSRNATVKLLSDENCWLGGAGYRHLTREGNERVLLIASEFWTKSGFRKGWVEMATSASDVQQINGQST